MEVLLGFVFGIIPLGLLVLLIVYLVKTNTLSAKVVAIEMQLRRLHQLEEEILDLKRKTQPTSQPEERPSPTQEVPAKIEGQSSAPQVVSTPVSHPPTVVQAPQMSGEILPPPRRPMPRPSRTREEWEALIGGKLLNRIGAVALIVGMGFFLKYAFDNNWITETMRVAIGFVIGLGLLFGAAWSHKKKFEIFAQGLVGAGLAVLYLSVFASFNFYHLVPQVTAFVIMSVVTILAFLQAFRYNSLAVSFIGLIGGFLTPFMLSTGEANEVGLFTYIALLDAGILAVVLMKDKWAVLEPVALLATYLTYLLWHTAYYTSANLLTTVYLVLVFWFLFFVLDLYRNLKSIDSFIEVRTGVAAANALLVYVCLYTLIEPEHHDLMGLVTLVLGVVYFAAALVVRWKSEAVGEVFFRQILTAMVLLVIATAIEFTGFRTVQWWSVEAVALIYCGVRWRHGFVWVVGTIVFALALIKLLYVPESFSTSPTVEVGLLLNIRAVTFALFSLSAGVGAFLLRKETGRRSHLVSNILDFAWPLVVFALLTVETAGFFRSLINSSPESMTESLEFKRLMTLPVVWMMYSLLLTWSGIKWNMVPWRLVGLGVAILSVCLVAMRGITYQPMTDFTLIGNFRFVTIVLVLVGVLVHSYWVRRDRYLGAWNADVLSVIGVVIVLLILDLITGETKDVFQAAKYKWEQNSGYGEGSAEWSRLSNLQQLSLSGVWLLYSGVLMIAGIWRRHRGVRISSIALFGFTIIKVFIYDLSFLQTLYRIFSFIGLGIILLAVSFLYQRYKDVIFGERKEGSGR